MAIAFITGSANAERVSIASASWSITGPGGSATINDMDIVLVGFWCDADATVNSVPSGLTFLFSVLEPGADFETFWYYGFGREAGDGPYAFGFTATQVGQSCWIGYSGVYEHDPFDPAITNSGGVSTTVVDTPLVGAIQDSVLVGVANTESTVATTGSWDAGVTERLDFNSVGGGAGTGGGGWWIGERVWVPGANQVNGDLTTARATTRTTIALNPSRYGGVNPSFPLARTT